MGHYFELFQKASLVLQSLMYVGVGITHFTHPKKFLKIMPPFIPFHTACIYISGVAEISLGTLLWFPKYKVITGYGLIALLMAVFPANIYCVYSKEARKSLGISIRKA